MNIVVPMKQIPDLQQVRIRNRKPLVEDAPKVFGDIDKNALEAAVALKEAGAADEVVVVSYADEDVEDTVKEAMAAGADRSVLIEDDDAYDTPSTQVAAVLAEAIKGIDDAGLIIFGEGSGDNYSGQVGSRVAALLGYPQVGFAQAIEVNGDTATITRALEDTLETVEVALPAVVVVAGGLNTPRLPSVMQVLKAGKKPKDVMELDDLEVSVDNDASDIEIVSNLAPEVNRKNQMVSSVDELVAALKADGIVGR